MARRALERQVEPDEIRRRDAGRVSRDCRRIHASGEVTKRNGAGSGCAANPFSHVTHLRKASSGLRPARTICRNNGSGITKVRPKARAEGRANEMDPRGATNFRKFNAPAGHGRAERPELSDCSGVPSQICFSSLRRCFLSGVAAGGRSAMASVDITIIQLSPAEHQTQLRRAVIASTVGTAIEWYDFFLYSTVTGLVFAKLFFPN